MKRLPDIVSIGVGGRETPVSLGDRGMAGLFQVWVNGAGERDKGGGQLAE